MTPTSKPTRRRWSQLALKRSPAAPPGRPSTLFGPIVAVSVSENKFGGSVVVVDRPETAGSNE